MQIITQRWPRVAKCVTSAILIGCAIQLVSCAGQQGGAASHAVPSSDTLRAAKTASVARQDGWASVTEAPHNLVLHFGFDQSVMSSDDIANLKVQGKYLVAHPQAIIRIDGYTDSRGSREYNIGLGWRRARSVATVLQAIGVAKHQMVLNSFGAEKPVALGHTELAYRQNRRDELVYERTT